MATEHPKMLDILPPELLTAVLDNTSKTDQLNTSLVCRRVKSVIKSTRVLKKRPDEIRISTKLLHPVSYQIGKLRFDHNEKVEKMKRRLLVTLSKKKGERGQQDVMDTMEGDEVDGETPSTSSDLPQLREILEKCIHGTSLVLRSLPISTALLTALSSSPAEIERVTTITFDFCVFAEEEQLFENLRAFLQKTSVQCLTMEFSREEGQRRIICDELFSDLPHLQQLHVQERVQGANGITKGVIDRWIATNVPYMVNFRNVESNIDAESVRKLIEFTLRTPRRFKTVWHLGTIRQADSRELSSLMLTNFRGLTVATHIDMIGQRHFKITHSLLEIAFAMRGC